MRLLVTGATGELGRRALPELVAAGHEVVAVTRDDERAAWASSVGATPILLDLFDGDAVVAVVAGIDTVVNLATSIPAPRRAMLPRSWAENDRLRTAASTNVVAACREHGAALVQESVTFPYDAGGDDWIDEDHPRTHVAFTASSGEAEANARSLTEAGGRAVILRFGAFVAVGSPHTDDLLGAARRGWLAMLGRSKAWTTMVATADAATAVVAAVDAPAGTYNIVEDQPATRAEHATALAAVVGRPLRHPPVALSRIGPAEILARSQRISNRRFREATSWRPAVTSVAAAWPELIEGEVQGQG